MANTLRPISVYQIINSISAEHTEVGCKELCLVQFQKRARCGPAVPVRQTDRRSILELSLPFCPFIIPIYAGHTWRAACIMRGAARRVTRSCVPLLSQVLRRAVGKEEGLTYLSEVRISTVRYLFDAIIHLHLYWRGFSVRLT